MSLLFNPESSIKLLKEDAGDYLMIKEYGTNIPLYKFAKGYRIYQIDNDINSGNKTRITMARWACSRIKRKLTYIGNILNRYENKEIEHVNPDIKKQFIDNYVTSTNCFIAARTWENKENSAIRAQKIAAPENKYNKPKKPNWTSIYN